MREHFVVLSIRRREVARAQRSRGGRREDALQPLDFANSLLSVYPVTISNMSAAIVKRSGICAFPQWPVRAIPPVRIRA
jgi:hypothetical protein